MIMSLPRHWRRWTLLLVIALLVAWWVRPSAVEVEGLVVATGPLRETVGEQGETRVLERYVVAAPVTGQLRRMDLRAGDSVRRGQVVAEIEPTPLDTRERREAAAVLEGAVDAQRAADAAVLAANAALDQAVRSRTRAETLAAQGHLASAEREAAELEETTLRRQVEAARANAETEAHAVERARAALLVPSGGGHPGIGRTRILAPVSGRILRLLEESERVVTAGMPVLEIGDPTRLEVVTQLLSTDAVRVRPGDTMLVTQWGGGDTLRARVRIVEPSGFTKISALGVEEQRVNVVGELVEAAGSLGDRYRVDAEVVLWGSADVLSVPLSALVRNDQGWSVYSVSGGRAHLRPVSLGHRGAFSVEVVSGLAAGDTIIRYPTELMHEGIRVRLLAAR
jgi:HlyD family secretion protein